MNLDRYSDNFFEVNHLNGFLPKKSPLSVLPERYSELQELIDEMPIKKANGQDGLLAIEGAIEDSVKKLKNVLSIMRVLKNFNTLISSSGMDFINKESARNTKLSNV